MFETSSEDTHHTPSTEMPFIEMPSEDTRRTPSTPLLRSPTHVFSSNDTALSPVTPQPEDNDKDLGCHPKHGCMRNARTNVSDDIYIALYLQQP
jgi:hypothetical protein